MSKPPIRLDFRAYLMLRLAIDIPAEL